MISEAQIAQILRSVGKECFLRDLEVFKNRGMTRLQKAEYLVKTYGYRPMASTIRVANATRLINSGRLELAVKMAKIGD